MTPGHPSGGAHADPLARRVPHGTIDKGSNHRDPVIVIQAQRAQGDREREDCGLIVDVVGRRTVRQRLGCIHCQSVSCVSVSCGDHSGLYLTVGELFSFDAMS